MMERNESTWRRSGMLLRRAAACAVLMLLAQTALMAYTVTLQSGSRGEGSDIVINTPDPAGLPTSQSGVGNGQFWMEGEQLWYKFPDCPASFTAPAGEILLGWYIGEESDEAQDPGTRWTISSDLVLIAKWGAEEIEYGDGNNNLKFAVTCVSPLEAKLIEISQFDDGNLVIPAIVDDWGKEYSVVEIADGVCQNRSELTALTIAATVRRIGKEAFSKCHNLTTLTFAEGGQLTAMGQHAFFNCEKLKKIYNLPGSTESEEGYLFDSCGTFEEVTIWGYRNIDDGNWADIRNASTLRVTLPANAANGAMWTTFYSDGRNFQADDATTVYKATLQGSSLVMHEVEDRIVNDFTAVILKSTGNPVLTKTEAESSDGAHNDLKGCGEAMNTPERTYVLYGGEDGLGFYPYSGEKLNPGKAYIQVPASSGVKGYIGFTEGIDLGATDVQIPSAGEAQQEEAEAWTALDGRRLSDRPISPGIYLRSGRKVVIK
ncbi:MAG: leucine-rich repeat domain-containing protein [Bacteroidaceae bacterium]|nr:leucine-rich repeat domain-containing protein [Bacteroidaceae bacterium]